MGAGQSFPVVDLSGKLAIVTGGNAGIGYETVKALAVMGAHTIDSRVEGKGLVTLNLHLINTFDPS